MWTSDDAQTSAGSASAGAGAVGCGGRLIELVTYRLAPRRLPALQDPAGADGGISSLW